MDAFEVRDRLIGDYREFTGSFVDIHDKEIKQHVDERMASGYQWPDPWLSLNPSFAGLTYIIPVVDRVLRAKAEEACQPGIKAAKGLQFLVLDELHTYRGRLQRVTDPANVSAETLRARITAPTPPGDFIVTYCATGNAQEAGTSYQTLLVPPPVTAPATAPVNNACPSCPKLENGHDTRSCRT